LNQVAQLDPSQLQVIGILLAAGHSRRFGIHNKLQQTLPDGRMLALSSARHLLAVIPQSVAIVRAGQDELKSVLAEAGLQVTVCGDHQQEMGDSLAAAVHFAVSLYPQTAGVVIALADMPAISPCTIAAVAGRIAAGAGIVVPVFQGKRGHPVGFSVSFVEQLLSLKGDQGARVLLEKYSSALVFHECDDAGILLDIDTPLDLEQFGQ
jgi:molybdenum cofactor cytidylyltransferase